MDLTLKRLNAFSREKCLFNKSKAYPLPHGVSLVSVPLIAMQQGIHGKPKGGDTLGLAVGSFF